MEPSIWYSKKSTSKDTLNQQIFEYNQSLYIDDDAILFK